MDSIHSWAAIEIAIQSTSDAEFCGRCHTMEPMVRSYERDVHGGNDASGFDATRTSCHLSHDDAITYLTAKAEMSLHDVWAELTKDPGEIDWLVKREERERYAHNSGCLACHSRVADATRSMPRIFREHEPHFLGDYEKSRVSCHEEVGHRELEKLLKSDWPKARGRFQEFRVGSIAARYPEYRG